VGVAANISSSATAPGAAVKVDGTTGGSVTFSGTVTSTGTGDLFDVGSTLTPAGGAISFTGPTLSATGGGGALVSSLGGTATLNVTAPLSITNATGTGLSVTNVASTASASFGEVTVTTPGGTGIFIADNGTVTFGTTQVTLGAASTAGIEFLDINEHISFGTTTIDEVGANQTGIDFSGSSSGSSTRADFGLTTITGTGSLTSRGIDLSSTTGNKTITFLRGSSISNVGVGVELSSSGATATSANANFTFGDGTSADGLQSSISAAAGGYTVNTIGLDPTLGNYDFDDVNFTGAAHLASAVGGTIMISQGGGIVHANTDGLSADVTTYTVAEADAMTGTLNFAFVGTVDLSGTPFTLDSGQSIIGFGNGASILTSGTVQPVNVQGNLGATGGNVTGDEGVVKSTGSDTLHLLGNNQVRDTAFDFSGGSGSVFLVNGSAAGFVNTGGIFIEGVTVSNVAVGQTAFKVVGLDTNLSITNNNINVAGTLLDANGGSGDITVTRGSLPNSGPAGTLTGGGINLQNLTGTVTIGDGTLTNTGANTAFNVGSTTAGSGGSAIISYAGTINSNGTGAAVSIQSMTGGSVTLSGNLTDTNAAAGGNIVIAGNDSAAITFSGTSKVISSGATDAVSLGLVGNFPAGTPAPNTNSAINFTNGGLDITTTTGTGFIAFGDFTTGAVTVTGTGNEINSGADGLILFGANVGAGGVAFDSVSAVSTSTGAGVLLGGINLGGDVNIGGLRDTGYIGASLIGLSGAGVVNFTGKTDLDVSYRGFDIGGPLVGTINIANVAGSTLNIDGAEIGIALTTSSGTVNVGGNGGSASIGATTSTTGSAITLAGGNDLVHATLNYTGSINVSAGSVLQVGGGDWSELNMSGSVVSTSAVALPGTAVFTFSGNAEGVYNISSTINHTGSAVGVLFDGSSEGTATFSGTSKIFDTSSGANGAIVKLPSIGPTQGTGSLAFTGGNLKITTASGAGFSASTFGAGTISVSGTGNTITTGTGTALKRGD
ncbi:S-layer family protein, partial [Mesorhizobium sp. M7A.F.Ca.CA.002.03.2.1]